MARRRGRRRGHKQPIYRKIIKGIAAAGSAFLVGAPVTIPAAMALQHVMTGGRDPIGQFLYQASGYDMSQGALDQNYLTNTIIPRDIALVAIGLGLRWASKRI